MAYKDGFPKFQVHGLINDVSVPMRRPVEIFEDFLVVGQGDPGLAVNTGRYQSGGVNDALANVTNITSSDGGVARLLSTGADGDGQFLKLGNGGYLRMAGNQNDPRPIVYQTLWSPTSITTQTHSVGLCTVGGVNGNTEPVTTQASGLYFVIVNGAVQVTYKTSAVTVAAAAVTYLESGTVSTSVLTTGVVTTSTITAGTTVTLTAGVFYTFGISWDGISKARWYVNGLMVKEVTLAAFTVADLIPFFGVKAVGAAVAASIDCDYIWAACGIGTQGRC